MSLPEIILASKSPRRQQLLKELGISFMIKTAEIKETYPDHLAKEEIPVYLAKQKAGVGNEANKIILAADTIVYLGDEILGKPQDEEEAIEMIQKLSGRQHEVITGVCLKNQQKEVDFYETTTVHFNKLTEQEINYYVKEYQPLDKAGAYAIQEWIGLAAINRIEGCYYNVVGLPVSRVYKEIIKF